MNRKATGITFSTALQPGGQPAKLFDIPYSSIDSLLTSRLPEDFVFVYANVEGGRHVYAAGLGWKFLKTA